MKCAWLLPLALIVVVSCAGPKTVVNNASPVPRQSPTLLQDPRPARASENGFAVEPAKSEAVPAAFKRIDFKNFTYPTIPAKKSVRLKDGKFEVRSGIGGYLFELSTVNYADLTGDGVEEAIVDLFQLSCGGSCDGGSHLLFFFDSHSGRATLRSRIDTGSLAYGCGFKALRINRRILTLETFWKCHRKGIAVVADSDAEEVGKYAAKSFTRFVFAFRKGKLAQLKRETFPYPAGDAKNYTPEVTVEKD